MVQVLSTIFFSAAAMSALGVIASAFADDLGAVRVALGLSSIVPSPAPARVRIRRTDPVRAAAIEPAGSQLRAAA